jgi:hypothetical protein
MKLSKINLLIGLSIVGILIYIVYRTSVGQPPSAEVLNTAFSTNASNPAASIAQTPSNLRNATVQPSQSSWRELTLSKAELESHPQYWMLAYSAADKVWLERFGYPTLEEEKMLNEASLETLQKLTAAGDRNARTHLTLRKMQTALRDGDEQSRFEARGLFNTVLIEGGPYQAAKIVDFFAGLRKNPEMPRDMDEQRLSWLKNDFLQHYELANGLSNAYGDYAAARRGNGMSLESQFRLPAREPQDFVNAMRSLGNINRIREQRGLGPYEFIQRPAPPGQPMFLDPQVSNTVHVR